MRQSGGLDNPPAVVSASRAPLPNKRLSAHTSVRWPERPRRANLPGMARNTPRKRPDAQPDEPQRLDLPDHAATPPAKHPGGRPVVWTPERIAATKPLVLDAIADGHTVRTIPTLPDMPSWSTMREWLRSDVEFASQYARAREAAADQLAARVVDIADKVADGKLDAMQGRTAIDGYKWAASKLNARVYGDRLDVNANVNHAGSVGWVIDLSGTPVLDGTAVQAIEAPAEPSDPLQVVVDCGPIDEDAS